MMSWGEQFAFNVFERGEIAALGGISSEECPYSKERDSPLRELWFRGYTYGGEEGDL